VDDMAGHLRVYDKLHGARGAIEMHGGRGVWVWLKGGLGGGAGCAGARWFTVRTGWRKAARERVGWLGCRGSQCGTSGEK
jgi:hypothetical protein